MSRLATNKNEFRKLENRDRPSWNAPVFQYLMTSQQMPPLLDKEGSGGGLEGVSVFEEHVDSGEVPL